MVCSWVAWGRGAVGWVEWGGLGWGRRGQRCLGGVGRCGVIFSVHIVFLQYLVFFYITLFPSFRLGLLDFFVFSLLPPPRPPAATPNANDSTYSRQLEPQVCQRPARNANDTNCISPTAGPQVCQRPASNHMQMTPHIHDSWTPRSASSPPQM